MMPAGGLLRRVGRAARLKKTGLATRTKPSSSTAAAAASSSAAAAATTAVERTHYVSGHAATPPPPPPASDQDDRTSLLTEIVDEPGALYRVLSYFWKHDVQLTAIESRPSNKNSVSGIYLSFLGKRGDAKTDKLLAELKKQPELKNILLLDDKVVPWFPKHLSDLDKVANRVVDADAGQLEADHPGFTDALYRERRRQLAQLAKNYVFHEPVPRITYTAQEVATWGVVYRRLSAIRDHACREYKEIMPLMEKACGYGPDSIPQVADISRFLTERTGFRIRPVAGLLSSRDFLNALAFRVFFSTQYIRHDSRPLYTPEPDICHELLGHAPMFDDPDFADFSHEIGLASLGASDHDVKRLATCYWHSVEFGLLREEGGKLKAYGAGVLSSFGEMEHAMGIITAGQQDQSKSKYLPWDPAVASETEYPITTYQPTYFVANGLADAKAKMRQFSDELPRPFRARYNPHSGSIWVDRPVSAGAV